MEEHACCGSAADTAAVERVAGARFICPMHPEIQTRDAADCPICGMALEPMAPDRALLTDDTEQRELWALLLRALPPALVTFALAMSEMTPWSLPDALDRIDGWIQLGCTAIVFWCGRVFFVRGWRSVATRNFNMWTLIAIGTLAAFGFSLISLTVPGFLPPAMLDEHGRGPLYFEAAAVIITLVLLGQYLEARARGKTSAALVALIDLAPATARVIDEDGSERDVPLDNVTLGDRVRLRPGEKVPVDGVVLEGSVLIDESMLTGEPYQQSRSAGEPVAAGTVNQTGTAIVRAERVGSDTVLSRIIDLVATAQRSTAPVQRLADRVAAWFVPGVVAVAAIAGVVWAAVGPPPAIAHALVAVVSVLIIACPCALGLATPMSIMVGIGRGAHSGILIRDAAVLERMAEVDVLISDKTGTLTAGVPAITDILVHADMDETSLLALAGGIELHSEHPLGDAFRRSCEEREITPHAVTDVMVDVGKGLRAEDAGRTVRLGSEAYLEGAGIDVEAWRQKAEQLRNRGATVVWISREATVLGLFAVRDPVKKTAPTALQSLANLGIDVIMATGDNPTTAAVVANELDIPTVRAGLSPSDKHDLVRELQAQGRVVAVAGDGINDAPALAAADVGIAMGNGTDVAIESAAITLLRGDLHGIVRARRLSAGTRRNIRQNLFFAFVYNFVGVPIAAGVLYPLTGMLMSPMIAALAMSLSSVSVIGNALRLRRLGID